jgi:hypothetical protein
MVYGIIWQMLQLHSEWGRVEHGGNFMSMAGSEACKDFRNPERSASTSKLKAGPYLDSSSNKTILSRFFSFKFQTLSIDRKSCQLCWQENQAAPGKSLDLSRGKT